MSTDLSTAVLINTEELASKFRPVITEEQAKSLQEIKDGTRTLADNDLPLIASAVLQITKGAADLANTLIGNLLVDFCRDKDGNITSGENSSLAKVHKYLVATHSYSMALSTFYSLAQTVAHDRKYLVELDTDDLKTKFLALKFSARRVFAKLQSKKQKDALFKFATDGKISVRKIQAKAAELTKPAEIKLGATDTISLDKLPSEIINAPEQLFLDNVIDAFTIPALNSLDTAKREELKKKTEAAFKEAKRNAELISKKITKQVAALEKLKATKANYLELVTKYQNLAMKFM